LGVCEVNQDTGFVGKTTMNQSSTL
jgi:hypothetical protein